MSDRTGWGAAAAPVARAWRGVRWYARELSGESKWDEYVARCRRDGEVPVSRRTFERERDHAREHARNPRCC